jgi:hypothetical protein
MRLVAKVLKTPTVPKVRHYYGFPPEIDPTGKRIQMPPADILLIEEKVEGVYLHRFRAGGEFCGETWHMDLPGAKEQANFEFDQFLSQWIEAPIDVSDVVNFALTH